MNWCSSGAPDDLEPELQPDLRPGHQLPGVAGVGPGELDGAERLAQVPQQRPGSVAVLRRSAAVDQHGQQQPDGVDGDVPLAALHLLAASNPRLSLPTVSAAFTALRVDDRGRQARPRPAGRDAAGTAQLIMHLLGRAASPTGPARASDPLADGGKSHASPAPAPSLDRSGSARDASGSAPHGRRLPRLPRPAVGSAALGRPATRRRSCPEGYRADPGAAAASRRDSTGTRPAK